VAGVGRAEPSVGDGDEADDGIHPHVQERPGEHGAGRQDGKRDGVLCVSRSKYIIFLELTVTEQLLYKGYLLCTGQFCKILKQFK